MVESMIALVHGQSRVILVYALGCLKSGVRDATLFADLQSFVP